MKSTSLEQSDLIKLFDYDIESGSLRWKYSVSANARAGDEAGGVAHRRKTAYRVVRINRRLYLAHHIVWCIVTGKWPESIVDHKDLDGLNNRFHNLRAATHAQNISNAAISVANTSGFKGVWFDHQTQRWAAEIIHLGKKHWLGRFDAPDLAHAAYCRAATQFHGEFARFK